MKSILSTASFLSSMVPNATKTDAAMPKTKPSAVLKVNWFSGWIVEDELREWLEWFAAPSGKSESKNGGWQIRKTPLFRDLEIFQLKKDTNLFLEAKFITDNSDKKAENVNEA